MSGHLGLELTWQNSRNSISENLVYRLIVVYIYIYISVKDGQVLKVKS
jgi:hypothetical protein